MLPRNQIRRGCWPWPAPGTERQKHGGCAAALMGADIVMESIGLIDGRERNGLLRSSFRRSDASDVHATATFDKRRAEA